MTLPLRTAPIAALLAVACSTQPAADEQDALLDTPDAATRQVVNDAARALLDGAPLLLAADAFTHDSRVFIEAQLRRGPDGLRIEARDTAPPIVLRLSVAEGVCTLQREGNDRRLALAGVRCRPATASKDGGPTRD